MTLTSIPNAVAAVWLSYTRRLVPMMAAGVAFYFLLGMVPFLFLTTAVAGYFVRDPQRFEYLSTNLLGLLPPGLGERILSSVEMTAANWQAFGVVGLVALFFVSMGLFEAIDWGINGAMGTRKKVGFLKGRLIFLAYLTGAIIFFSLAAVTEYLFHLIIALPALEGVIEIPRRAFSMGAFAVFLAVLYMLIPVKTPRLYRAVLVALVIAGIWAVLQVIGTSLTVNISRRHAIYGALAGGTVFLTWMYLLASMILLGGTVLETWDRLSGERTPET